MAAFKLQWQTGVAATETLRLTKPKIFTVWIFAENFAPTAVLPPVTGCPWFQGERGQGSLLPSVGRTRLLRLENLPLLNKVLTAMQGHCCVSPKFLGGFQVPSK